MEKSAKVESIVCTLDDTEGSTTDLISVLLLLSRPLTDLLKWSVMFFNTAIDQQVEVPSRQGIEPDQQAMEEIEQFVLQNVRGTFRRISSRRIRHKTPVSSASISH